ncbi:MAG: endo alpha-1,4 polygalactosaminidase [Microbacterium sp.]
MRTRSSAAAIAVVAVLLSGCATADPQLPPAGGSPDYQLGGAYEPAPEVDIVGRDRSAEPADVYSICYVNGFQTQPGELDDWPAVLLLRSPDGTVVMDPDWPDEALLDTSSATRRDAIVSVVQPWIEGCADAGFEAVEFDNLDTYARSGGALELDANLLLASRFVEIAHAQGLAAGQKNAAEDSRALRDRAHFDFAVVEECAAFRECDTYAAVYGEHVIDIEYTDATDRPFTEVCADPSTPASTVLRDRQLTTPSSPDHVFEVCGAP